MIDKKIPAVKPLGEIRALKIEAEKKIREILTEFELQTSLTVKNVQVDAARYQINKSIIMGLKIDVDL